MEFHPAKQLFESYHKHHCSIWVETHLESVASPGLNRLNPVPPWIFYFSSVAADFALRLGPDSERSG